LGLSGAVPIVAVRTTEKHAAREDKVAAEGAVLKISLARHAR